MLPVEQQYQDIFLQYQLHCRNLIKLFPLFICLRYMIFDGIRFLAHGIRYKASLSLGSVLIFQINTTGFDILPNCLKNEKPYSQFYRILQQSGFLQLSKQFR